MLGDLSKPLSATELEELVAGLDELGGLDIFGLNGLLHAVTVAPSLIPPSVWLPLLFGDGQVEFGKAHAQLVLRQYQCIVTAKEPPPGAIPEATDEEGCTSFATGFVAGAELDPEWLEKPERWVLAAPLVYLAGRFELLPERVIEQLDTQPNFDAETRTNLATIIRQCGVAFARLRGPGPTIVSGPRIGRNDPCPCGSGRKYKRCCGA